MLEEGACQDLYCRVLFHKEMVNSALTLRRASLSSLALACVLSPLSHLMAGMDAQIPVHATFFLQSPKWCHSVKGADMLEQAKDTCSITRQVCFSHRGCPGSVSIFLIGVCPCVQRGSALAACRAVCARRRSSYCAINRRRSRLEGCVLCHSAQHMLQKHSFCSSDCATGRSCQRGRGKVNHHTLNKFSLIPSALDILEESWPGAWRCAKRGAWLLRAGMMGQSQGMGGVEEQDLCTGMRLSRHRS